MSESWSKEDRNSFDKSEVMQELELKVLNTIRRIDILQEKIATKTPEEVGELTQALNTANESAKELQTTMKDMVDDPEGEEDLRDDVVDDLRDLAAAAISEGNIKLAYRIERTIDEILEQDTPCI
jgi:predicted transcriptional regulator